MGNAAHLCLQDVVLNTAVLIGWADNCMNKLVRRCSWWSADCRSLTTYVRITSEHKRAAVQHSVLPLTPCFSTAPLSFRVRVHFHRLHLSSGRFIYVTSGPHSSRQTWCTGQRRAEPDLSCSGKGGGGVEMVGGTRCRNHVSCFL